MTNLADELEACESLSRQYEHDISELRQRSRHSREVGAAAVAAAGVPSTASTYLREENRTLLNAVVRLQEERDELKREASALKRAAMAHQVGTPPPTLSPTTGLISSSTRRAATDSAAVRAAADRTTRPLGGPRSTKHLFDARRSHPKLGTRGHERHGSAETLQAAARRFLFRLRRRHQRQWGTAASAATWSVQSKLSARRKSAELTVTGESADDHMRETWRAASWLTSLGTSEVVARALLKPLRAIRSEKGEGAELRFVRMLGRLGDRASILTLLRDGAVLEHLADELWRGVKALEEGTQSESQVAGLYSKFCSEGNRTLQYGTLSTFYSGLSGVIGPPSPNLADAMRREHCASDDSLMHFTSNNYGILTSSQIEYAFVVAPEEGLKRLGLSEWPTEEKLKHDPQLWERRRRPTNLSSFDEHLRRVNTSLGALDCAPLGIDELIGARLYTGALYVKYNAVLRAAADPNNQFNVRRCHSLCRGNKYVTTIHVISSAIIKLGKIMPAERVYRGVSESCIPRGFWQPDEFKIRGGIELGFMSATLDPEIAYGYAAARGKGMMVFETHMGMVDRGADLSWLSQFPLERETTFPPLTGLEVRAMRVHDAILVVEVRLDINLGATIEQVIAKMQSSHLQLLDIMREDLFFAGVPRTGLAPLVALRRKQAARGGAWFNSIDNYKQATAAALEARRGVLESMGAASAWREVRNERVAKQLLRNLRRESRHPEPPPAPDGVDRPEIVEEGDVVEEEDDDDDDETGLVKAWGERARTESAVQGRMLSIGTLCALEGVHEPAVSLVCQAYLEQQTSRAAIAAAEAVSQALRAYDDDHPEVAAHIAASRAAAPAAAAAAAAAAAPEGPSDPMEGMRPGPVGARGGGGRAAAEVREQADVDLKLRAAALLLHRGAVAPWPPMLVALATAGGDARASRLLGAFCILAAQLAEEEATADVRGSRVSRVSRVSLPEVGTRRSFDGAASGRPAGLRIKHAGRCFGWSEADGCWRPGTVTRTHADGTVDLAVGEQLEAFDRAVGGELRRLPPTSLLLVRSGGAGALLREAAAVGCLPLLDALLAAGVSTQCADASMATPLHAAAAAGQAAACARLVAAGSDARSPNLHGQRPADLACAVGDVAVLRALQPSVGDVDVAEARAACAAGGGAGAGGGAAAELALLAAAEEGDTAAVLEVDAQRGRAAAATAVDAAPVAGVTPLMLACLGGHVETARALLSARADVDARSRAGCTALCLAAEEGAVDAIELLLASSPSPDASMAARRSDGATPLLLASAHGLRAAAPLLRGGPATAELHVADALGRTPLMVAATYGRTSLAARLVALGAAVDARRGCGRTALHAACRHGHEDVVRLLVEAEATLDVQQREGLTPLMYACARRDEGASDDEEVVHALLSAGASVGVTAADGTTALMMACAFGDVAIVYTLLEHGADTSAARRDGATARVLAHRHGRDEVIAALDDHEEAEAGGSAHQRQDEGIISPRKATAVAPAAPAAPAAGSPPPGRVITRQPSHEVQSSLLVELTRRESVERAVG